MLVFKEAVFLGFQAFHNLTPVSDKKCEDRNGIEQSY